MGLFWGEFPFLKFHRELMLSFYLCFCFAYFECLFASIFLHPFEIYEILVKCIHAWYSSTQRINYKEPAIICCFSLCECILSTLW
jgi:hypothetical protein